MSRRAAAGAFLVLVLAAATVGYSLPIRDSLAAYLQGVRELGPWGPIAVGLLYIPACVLLLPGSVLTIGAGFLFGVVGGTIAVSLGSVAGATVAFLIGRTLARPWVEQQIAAYPRFQAIENAVARDGLRIVLLVRLSPLFPFNFLNYAFGLTKVRLRDYVLGSWIGMFPGTLMYVYIGSGLKNLAEAISGRRATGPAGTVLFVAGLVATIVVTIYVTRLARRALDEEAPPKSGEVLEAVRR